MTQTKEDKMRITKDAMLKEIKPNYMKFNVYSVDDIVSKHKGHFFSKDTMRFFKSKLVSDVYVSNSGKVYFVTSEKKSFDTNERAFTVREYDLKLDKISSVGEFLSYETKAKALTEALRLAFKGE